MTTLSTLYNCAGVPQALVVAILPGAPGQTGPTGQACVGGQGFGTDTGAAAPFVFASLQGTISTWNAGTTAVTQFTATDHAIYTGLTVAGANLYAADARERQRLTSSTTPSTRYPCQVPSRIPRCRRASLRTSRTSTQAVRHLFRALQPGGYVAVFDQNGNLLQHISDPHLN